MELTDKQWELFDFVKQQHRNQERKYSGEPYFVHLLRTAEILSNYSLNGGELEIALCHDILELTTCSKQEFAQTLIGLGYDLFTRSKILKGVYDLTNKYTEAKYPQLSLQERNRLEAERLVDIEPFSQTVKYAEIIDNLDSIMEHDTEFAEYYVNKISLFINEMNEGNKELYTQCMAGFKNVKTSLSKPSKILK